MDETFRFIMKSSPKHDRIPLGIKTFKTNSFWSKIADLSSKIRSMEGVGRSDPGKNITINSELDHIRSVFFFSTIPSNLLN